MAVVINELEVAPQPAAAAPGKPEAQQEGSKSASPELVKNMEKLLHVKHQRNRRLEAY